jgi:hypothetical protein
MVRLHTALCVGEVQFEVYVHTNTTGGVAGEFSDASSTFLAKELFLYKVIAIRRISFTCPAINSRDFP